MSNAENFLNKCKDAVKPNVRLAKLLQKRLLGGAFMLLYFVIVVAVTVYIALYYLNATKQLNLLFSDAAIIALFKDSIFKGIIITTMISLGGVFNYFAICSGALTFVIFEDPQARYYWFLYIPFKCTLSLLLLSLQNYSATVVLLDWEVHIAIVFGIYKCLPGLYARTVNTVNDEYWLLQKELA